MAITELPTFTTVGLEQGIASRSFVSTNAETLTRTGNTGIVPPWLLAAANSPSKDRDTTFVPLPKTSSRPLPSRTVYRPLPSPDHLL